MSLHKFELKLHVDDDALGEHNGARSAPPDDIEDWTVKDIAVAIDLGIVVPEQSEVEWYAGEAS